ncbi:MAG: hypothetical protein WAM14_10190 [Candidatus Nitrosopolaris sp.]
MLFSALSHILFSIPKPSRQLPGPNGKIPVEASEIKVEGNNKWVTLIQIATKEGFV